MKDPDLTFTGTGQLVWVHGVAECLPPCVIHTPSDHHMRTWPLHWRGDRGIMERICAHSVGHPDPDDLAYRRTAGRDDGAGVHGCCGCCVSQSESNVNDDDNEGETRDE